MKISCAIIDDEPLAAELLQSYVKKTPYLGLVGTYNSAITAMEDLRNNPVQLLYLDIQMPELSGIEFAKVLPKETKVIFTTAFPQYAIEGFKVNALDYLLKPVSYEDFLRSADKAQEWFSAKMDLSVFGKERHMFVKSDYKLVRVDFDEILFIEGVKDYMHIHLKNGDKIKSLMSLRKVEEYLPKPEFLRTHRSYIVHMSQVSLIDRYHIIFGEKAIPISENSRDEILGYLNRHTVG